ncbi:hypothetical protein LSAT2_030115 [Lamellibrachia satsuma]|nr:hypothetical protein LSAT2_030115 [Lamellibrachia satsuma]
MWANYSVTYVRKGQTSKTTKTAAHDLTQLEIKPLVAGTTYHVTVYTLSGPYSSSGASMDVTTKPSTVAEISLNQRTPTSLDLSWSKPDGTVGQYKLLISPNDGGEQLPVTVPSGSALSHQFSNLKPGHSYVVTITVVSSGKDGEKATRTLTTNPLPPPSLTVSATATTSVTVTWTYDSSKSLTTQWRVNCKTVDGSAKPFKSSTDGIRLIPTITNPLQRLGDKGLRESLNDWPDGVT